MADQRVYQAPDLDLQQLGAALLEWFQSQGFEAQSLPAPGDGILVQARRPEGWRMFVGMSAALNVTVARAGEAVTVQCGAAPWTDKAVVGAVGVLLFWPALVPAAYGAWKQKKLPDQVLDFCDQYVMSGGAGMLATPIAVPVVATAPVRPAAAPAEVTVACPSCGEQVRAGSKFCDKCGASMERKCAQCGVTLRAGAKFCDACGAKV